MHALHCTTPVPAMTSDEELVARILAGDGAGFELLMRRHNQRLYRTARAVLKNDLDAEDVVQEAYVRAFTHLDRFEGRSSVATWLTRIAFHEALRRRRRRLLDRRARLAAPARTPEVSEDSMDRAESQSMLTDAVDALPASLRAIVMLRLVQGLSTRETAECLRLSEASVKVGLHRARRMLFESIQERSLPALRKEFEFGATRCDRVVATVLERINASR